MTLFSSGRCPACGRRRVLGDANCEMDCPLAQVEASTHQLMAAHDRHVERWLQHNGVNSGNGKEFLLERSADDPWTMTLRRRGEVVSVLRTTLTSVEG